MAFLSVVISTRNRPELLQQCLDHLNNQTLEATGYEIVVVDDGSDAPPVQSPTANGGPRVCHLRQPPRGPAAARNRGVSAASGEVIVFLGDDIFVPPDFLQLHSGWHREHPSVWEGMLGAVHWPSQYLRDDYMQWLDRSGLQFGYAGLRAGSCCTTITSILLTCR